MSFLSIHKQFTAMVAGVAALLAAADPVRSQEIIAGEYYISTDPGTGNGTPITLPAEGLDTFTVEIPPSALALLPNGLLHVSVRFLDEDGEWSTTEARPFILNECGGVAETPLAGGEFFINEDPGYGNGIPTDAPGNGMTTHFSFALPSDILDELAPGLHWLGVRFRNEADAWSTTEARPFVLNEGAPPGNLITRIDYRWYGEDGSVASPTHSLIPGTPAGLVLINESALLAGLLPGETYQLAVEAFDNSGLRTSVEIANVLIDAEGFPLWAALANLPGNMRGPFDTNGPLNLPNLLAYAMGLDPLVATNADLPMIGSHNTEEGTVSFHYRRATDTPGTSLKPVVSTDLIEWQVADTDNLTILESQSGWELVKLVLAVPSSDQFFLRLEAAETP